MADSLTYLSYDLESLKVHEGRLKLFLASGVNDWY